jgi:hypothetical protein
MPGDVHSGGVMTQYTWHTATVTAAGLDARLNELADAGWEIFQVSHVHTAAPSGSGPEAALWDLASNVFFIIVARQAMTEGDWPGAGLG